MNPHANPHAVETGRTRCPRCMVMAEYRFLERDADMLEYEVRCGECGHVHSELSHPSTAA